jgi:hypothetical protein
MVKFAFAIGGFINTVINEPVLFGLRIDIDTVNDADALIMRWALMNRTGFVGESIF